MHFLSDSPPVSGWVAKLRSYGSRSNASHRVPTNKIGRQQRGKALTRIFEQHKVAIIYYGIWAIIFGSLAVLTVSGVIK